MAKAKKKRIPKGKKEVKVLVSKNCSIAGKTLYVKQDKTSARYLATVCKRQAKKTPKKKKKK